MSDRVVLDTHAWIWWVAVEKRLSRTARSLIGRADTVVVPAICCWEVAMLVRKGRLELDRDLTAWVRQALGRPGVLAVPTSPQISLAAALLEEPFPADPADRLIYATARDQGAALITKDDALRSFDPRGTAW